MSNINDTISFIDQALMRKPLLTLSCPLLLVIYWRVEGVVQHTPMAFLIDFFEHPVPSTRTALKIHFEMQLNPYAYI
jgi:hypothetical protein